MESTLLVVSILLNFLLIISTIILIWDRFKPKINLTCEVYYEEVNDGKDHMYLFNFHNQSQSKIKLLRIYSHSEEIKKYGINVIDNHINDVFVIDDDIDTIIESQNKYQYQLFVSKDDLLSMDFKVDVSKGMLKKTLDFHL